MHICTSIYHQPSHSSRQCAAQYMGEEKTRLSGEADSHPMMSLLSQFSSKP